MPQRKSAWQHTYSNISIRALNILLESSNVVETCTSQSGSKPDTTRYNTSEAPSTRDLILASSPPPQQAPEAHSAAFSIPISMAFPQPIGVLPQLLATNTAAAATASATTDPTVLVESASLISIALAVLYSLGLIFLYILTFVLIYGMTAVTLEIIRRMYSQQDANDSRRGRLHLEFWVLFFSALSFLPYLLVSITVFSPDAPEILKGASSFSRMLAILFGFAVFDVACVLMAALGTLLVRATGMIYVSEQEQVNEGQLQELEQLNGAEGMERNLGSRDDWRTKSSA
ncbi:hypothetical protein LTS02_002239 [Friedmanniomyces endolithicus]|nr:hypothetical protein LTR94_000858 [Friedmanniomyces endolithicus]KAK0808341.1 hypothetical protein LTR59_002943 [Friedmanniomyces endolithicus]KAK0817782.1 hypothetical protein LTR38_001403 [Friedmanniomyces endolithicus]KAK0870733.1 hypothetical protein LTS02_002239 [Friedmanniomyces endolithicus]KAK0885014.1 hypothetical protein LTR87_001412 [Friedmanniomyces endolithicus]